MKTLSAAVLLILLLMLSVTATAAQNDARVTTLNANEVTILKEMNLLRLYANYPHLVPNPDLIALAHRHLADLLERGPANLGDVFLSSELDENGNRLNIESLLAREGYPAYPTTGSVATGYVVDFMPIVIRGVGPDDIMNFWNDDVLTGNPTLRSRSMVREGVDMPLYRAGYREVGIAYQSDGAAINERFYYVLVFAAQPNVIPFVVYNPEFDTPDDTPEVILDRVNTRNVRLRIHNENAAPLGSLNPEIIMGRVEFIRITEDDMPQDCPFTAGGDWINFDADVAFTLSAGSGLKSIYIQMCDAAGRTVTSSQEIAYVDPNAPTATPSPSVEPTPAPLDPLALAEATQTQAAIQTQAAPLLPTIEAILTGTAAAPTAAP